jgi:hypothetical protein
MARILYVDIETSPNLADVWGLWDQNVSLDMLRQSGHIMGFAYRWGGGGKARWVGEYNAEKGDLSNHQAMLEKAHQLYDEADIVVTYNGNRFDNPYFNTEWIKAGLTPPSPVLSLDLFATVKRQFRFPSNKLDYVCMVLLDDRKVKHPGYQMWKDCLDDGVDPKVRAKGWRNMSRYARQDVDLLEPLHDKLRPWLPNTINVAVFGQDDVQRCGKCASPDLERRGFAHTAAKRYQRFRCKACGAWARGTAKVVGSIR